MNYHNPSEATSPSADSGTTVAKSAAIMGVATFLSRIAGLLREQSFAYFFGAGIWTDAFNVAFRIPNLLRDLFAEGAMSAAFVPTFNAELTNNGKERAFRLTNLTLSALLVVVGVICIAGIVISPLLVGILAPEFRNTPEKFEVTVLMTRIMFPFLLAISWSAIAMGILNSLGKFFIPAIAPVLLNFSMIIAGFTLCPLFLGWGYASIVGMAVGAMIGGILQMAIQFPALWRAGFRYIWEFNLNDKGLRKIMKLIVPGTIGLAATQINVAVSTILATSQGDGAVSWLGYAFRLMQLPLGIFGVAIAQATLPAISRQVAALDRKGMKDTLASSIKLTAFINISCSCALAALAEPIIRILFQHGRFTATDTVATALALKAYATGLFFFSLIKVLGPAFYALDETHTPMMASIVSVVANIILNLALIGPCSYWGLALGSSVAAGINALFLYITLEKRLEGFSEHGIITGFMKILLVSGLSSLSMHFSFPWFRFQLACLSKLNMGSMMLDAVSLVLAGILGTTILFISAKAIGIHEADSALKMIKRKMFGAAASKNI